MLPFRASECDIPFMYFPYSSSLARGFLLVYLDKLLYSNYKFHNGLAQLVGEVGIHPHNIIVSCQIRTARP